jgi:arabinose-5-phosphate isomerase
VKDRVKILKQAREVLDVEANGILSLKGQLDESFVRAVELLLGCKGKVVVTGLGKSGLICRKIAATLSSTGTPSFFLHAGDGIHGDLGMIMKGDVVLAVSNSGETEELLKLVPIVKRLGLKLIAMTGNPKSALSQAADVSLNVIVKEEACSLGLSPTTSTTAALAMGDALAVVLLRERHFKAEDYALRHPGGILGRRLLLHVEDLMHQGEDLPLVGQDTPMKDTILEITSKRLGVTGVTGNRGQLVGIVTDGDLRRGLESKRDIFSLKAKDLMTKNPKTVPSDELASQALALMERHSITSLFIQPNGVKRPAGIIHIHDLLKAGIV